MKQLPGIIVSLWTLWGFALLGKKRASGWVVAFSSEFAWAAYAVWLRQWSLLPMCVVFAFVYARNWLEWSKP